MSDERVKAALEKLDDALREFAQTLADDEERGQIFVSSSFVCWEQTWYDEDGENLYLIKYALPGATTGASAVGVARLGTKALEHDLAGMYSDEDEG